MAERLDSGNNGVYVTLTVKVQFHILRVGDHSLMAVYVKVQLFYILG